jgi:hypothetical protein
MSADIAIGCCRIEARAKPGSGLAWADEASQRAFGARVQALVLAMLDELLAPYLTRLGAGAVPRTLALNLKLDARDLAGAAPLARTHLRNRLIEAIAAAVASAPPGGAKTVPRATAADRPPAPAVLTSTEPVLGLLLRWHEGRQLEYRLALLSAEALTTLIEGVLGELAARPGAASAATSERAAVVEQPEVPATRGGRGPGRHALRAALRSLVEAAAALEPGARRPAQTRLARASEAASRAARRARAAVAPLKAGETGDPPRATSEQGADGSALERRRRPVPGAAAPAAATSGGGRGASPRAAGSSPGQGSPLADGRYEVESLLPFLALQPLARHGILDALAAAGGPADPVSALLFATALRTLAPPADGRWSAAQQVAAALCCGREAPFDGAALLALARDATGICELASAAVAGTLIAGHRPGLPLPILRDGDRLVVFESEGLYPLCRLSAARIADAFAGREEIFFLADPDLPLLRELDSAGVRAAATGTPARGESWAALAVRGWRGMTNLDPARASAVGRRLPEAEASAQRAGEVWRALTAERPLVPDGAAGPSFRDFDRTAAILAGFALADIAWTLLGHDPAAWAEPDPLLAVERFADLSGTLVFTADEVIVTLPLGARFADLRDCGLLATVRSVPWWPGRILSFRGG